MKKLTRHQMRECVFLLIFEKIFNDESVEDILTAARESDIFAVDPSVEAMFSGVEENLCAIDEEIKPFLKGWTIDRISRVSLAILRLGVYEILFTEGVDDDIVVSECVKLATAYAYDDDVSFINGVLGALVRSRAAN